MYRKRLAASIIGATLIAASAFAGFGGTAAEAHGRGHQDGCKTFGRWVSGELAGPEFGVIHQIVAPSAPMAISNNVDSVGHAMCGN